MTTNGEHEAHLVRTERPDSIEALGMALKTCGTDSLAIYPRGGGTALDYGGRPSRPGVTVETSGLSRVVDYPAGDMTITIEAGMTLAELQTILSEEGQRLPLDAPQPERATLGGIFATNTSGPRRFGAGRPRDMILGVGFVTPDGALIRGGGRVVKNVAGYDFPRLLTGSLGTLGVIVELTLKVRPKPVESALVWSGCETIDEAATALDRLNQSKTRPMAVELLNRRAVERLEGVGGMSDGSSSGWSLCLGYEESAAAVDWQIETVAEELGSRPRALRAEPGDRTWRALVAVTESPGSSWAVRVNVRPSAVPRIAASLDEAGWAVQAHAGSGIVRGFDAPEASEDDRRWFLERLCEAAVDGGGNLVIERCPAQQPPGFPIWGRPRGDRILMQRLGAAFDPRGLMNPGRLFDTMGTEAAASA